LPFGGIRRYHREGFAVADWLITGCSEVVTLRGGAPRRGAALRDLAIVKNAAVLTHQDRIAAVGPRRIIEALPAAKRADKIDLHGRVLLPGFVDSHTHLIFHTSRMADYELRIAGASEEKIGKSGGIQSTVDSLRKAKPDTLRQVAHGHLAQFASHGTTTIEAKSGYGLDWPSESKILKLLNELHQDEQMDICPTFLGAHIVPTEYRKRPEAYVKRLVEKWIPEVASEGLAKFCDVYCERGAFSLSQSRRILAAARDCGLVPRVHAEQFSRTGAAQLAIEMEAASADHLEHINRADTRALARSNVVCTLLPGCAYHLGLRDLPPARGLIDAGAIIAIATDFNPGTSPTLSMPMILSLACTQLRLTPAEAIAAATINPAYSLRLNDHLGSIEVGKYADFAAFDVADHREIPYYFGVNLCTLTMKRGEIVCKN
jgi:imidazolonepropionase